MTYYLCDLALDQIHFLLLGWAHVAISFVLVALCIYCIVTYSLESPTVDNNIHMISLQAQHTSSTLRCRLPPLASLCKIVSRM